jgi:hypothetical protein
MYKNITHIVIGNTNLKAFFPVFSVIGIRSERSSISSLVGFGIFPTKQKKQQRQDK